MPSSGMQDLLEKYKELFLEGLGTLQGFQAKICVDSDATPSLRVEQYLSQEKWSKRSCTG